MKNISPSENVIKRFFDKNKFLLFFETWITKIYTLIFIYPKNAGKDNILNYWIFFNYVLFFLAIIIPLELISFWIINNIFGKILKIILTSFDLFIYTAILFLEHKYYFPFTFYVISYSTYIFSSVLLLCFIFKEFNISNFEKNKEENNEAIEMLTIEKNI